MKDMSRVDDEVRTLLGPESMAAEKDKSGRQLDMIGWLNDLDAQLVTISDRNFNKTLRLLQLRLCRPRHPSSGPGHGFVGFTVYTDQCVDEGPCCTSSSRASNPTVRGVDSQRRPVWRSYYGEHSSYH